MTTQASWHAETLGLPTGWLVIKPTDVPGQMQSGRAGEAVVSASYGGLTASHAVLAMVQSTFKLSGTMRALDGGPIQEGSVVVLSGIGIYLRAPVHPDGHFILYGVAGHIELRAGALEYPSVTEQLDVAYDSTHDFQLVPYPPPATDLSGMWTLTLSASSGCRGQLPEVARDRSYDVSITQQGYRVTATLIGPAVGSVAGMSGRFDSTGTLHGDQFDWGIAGDTDMGDWSTTDFIEQLSPTAHLGLGIGGRGTVTGPEIRIPTAGDIEFWNEPFPPDGRPTAICRATDHSVVLRRR